MAQPRILIVDDDPVIQLLLRVNMEMDGFEVLTADDGEAGYEAAVGQRPDLVLLDVMMPKLDGNQVLAQLRDNESTKSLPVIMLSARPMQDGSAAADAYLTKPFEPSQVIEEIRRVLAA